MKHKLLLISLVSVVLLLSGCCCCSSSDYGTYGPDVSKAPATTIVIKNSTTAGIAGAATVSPLPVPAPVSDVTPLPSPTVFPASTPVPSATISPTVTAIPAPTAIPTPLPTVQPVSTPVITLAPATPPSVPQQGSLINAPYIGNSNTKKFHYNWCSSVGQIDATHIVPFTSAQEAVSQGYVACKKCNP